MDRSILYYLIFLVGILMVFSVAISFISIINYYHMSKACSDEGGVFTNNLCRIGNNFYGVYLNDNNFISEYVVIKSQVRYRN